MKKDLLSLKDLSADEIQTIFEVAKEMKEKIKLGDKSNLCLKGKSIHTLFYENSTRTRMSFELASKYLGGIFTNISSPTSSASKGETLIDTGKTIDMMGVDVIVLRHPMAGAPSLLANNVKASVINAGDGMNEHPTQALLDMFTIMESKGTLKGLKVAIIGDILHSRVARSNIWGLLKLGAEVTVAGPSTLLPREIEKMGINVFSTVQEALLDADVAILLRIQKERQNSGFLPSIREYSKFFGVDKKRMRFAKEDALILHPGPVNRGIELTSDVIDGEHSLINDQVTNGVAIRMAILKLLTSEVKE